MSSPPAKAPSVETTQPDDIKEAVEKAVGSVVSGRQAKQITEKLTAIVVREQFSGPLPHPKHMYDYANLIPDGPERIMAMAEKSLAHTINQETKAMDAAISSERLGLHYGIAALVLLIGAAVFAIWFGAHYSVPISFVGASAIGGIAMFIKGRNQ